MNGFNGEIRGVDAEPSRQHSYHGNKVFVDYLYCDHTRLNVCVKTKILNFEPRKLIDVPWSHVSVWPHPKEKITLENFYKIQEKLVKPVALFQDPFRLGRHKIVLCDIMEDSNTPIAWSYRDKLVETAKRADNLEILMGFEQEYYIYGGTISTEKFFEQTCANYLDNVGLVKDTSLQRQMAEDHINACLIAGLNMYGYNREKANGQWEYQLGPSDPVSLADHTVVARYLMQRTVERHNVQVSFLPWQEGLPYPNSLQLSFSTGDMRKEGGLRAIQATLDSISKIPQEQLLVHYDRNGGRDNAVRLSGKLHLPMSNFSVGWGVKNSSFRVPSNTMKDGYGYIEERRPSADCDPYELIYAFIKIALLKEQDG